ncbi:hypothetical protein [Marivita sp. GX14005]|uniref:hypothetical protein n=1 Tax=Marivita sp. GX14005 TaxID=2942276 RepID=UPI0020193963|nr:hypothetical protein [Marivita sp. GX14005]MCL3881134.1 hypothetical protein [Marivita sp. GX14005]
MAAISFIAGSILGWIAALSLFLLGAVVSTVIAVFMIASLGGAGAFLYLAARSGET